VTCVISLCEQMHLPGTEAKENVLSYKSWIKFDCALILSKLLKINKMCFWENR
jgi:hypothetical protein